MTATAGRPTVGTVEERTALDVPAPTVDGRRLHGVIPYSIESRDLGGFREIIEPGALAGADLSDLIATREHDRSKLLGRHPTTLTTEDRSDGFAWSVELPQSPVGEDVRVAVERGDLRSTSWRMVVGRDRWDGDVRHVEQISALRDVTITASPAYGDAARAEYRSTPEPDPPVKDRTDTTTAAETRQEDNPMQTEDRTEGGDGGGLRVEHRAAVTREQPRGLAEELRAAGFPGETATVPFEHFEDRAVTWTGSVDGISPVARQAGPLGADQRYAWPAFPRVAVDAGDTSVQVMTQTARTLPTAASMIRAIDATTAKPEVGSTLTVSPLALKQVPAIQTGVPNVFLEQQAFNTVIENDLRLAINEGLDKLALDSIAGSGFQAPGTDPLLVSIRKAITTIAAAGYSPDTLILTPQAAEALDVLVSGVSGGVNDYVFAPAQFSPGSIFGLARRVSKTAAAPVVADSAALGKLYASPIALARFEADAGTTNKSNVRLELNAAFGVERQNAAVRIAAS